MWHGLRLGLLVAGVMAAVGANPALCPAGAPDGGREHALVDLVAGLRAAATPVGAFDAGTAPGAFEAALAAARVVGLGEATHGQRETFELKRGLTLWLVRKHGFRVVAYEAPATSATACDDYIAGRSDDLPTAMAGLGMLIWNVEENADLLRELRAWNATVPAAERVRFVGVDVQDADGAARQVAERVGAVDPGLAREAEGVARELEASVGRLWAGEAGDYMQVAARAREIESAVARWTREAPGGVSAEALRSARLLRYAVEAFHSPGARDRAMAEVLLEAIGGADGAPRAVVWAHNAHVTRGPLRYLQSDEPGMGGHLGKALGDRYYAVGFAFGGGGFHALARGEKGEWVFRAYEVPQAPTGALETPLIVAGADVGDDLLIDLRSVDRVGPAGRWLTASCGHVWFGGYGIPEDVATQVSEASRLPQTVPGEDFDGLVFHRRTTPSRPFRRRRGPSTGNGFTTRKRSA